MDSYFCANNLSKHWDTVDINISFSAQKNTMTTIVGPSGSGKSTILRLIAGLEQSDCGDSIITLDGKNITSVNPGKRETGMVSQSGALFLHMTVEDNIAYGLECRGISRKEARRKAELFLLKFKMEGFAKRYPETLSGGEAQRVSIARTLIVKPKLILFDEPLSALDAPLRKQLASEIRLMQKENDFTGIMVTHDIEEAKTISDKIIIVDKGKKVWEGLPQNFSENML